MRRLLYFLALLAVSGGTLYALEIQETRWGFDGRVLPERFNPLSVLVVNPGATPFEGELVLEASRGLERVGARIVEPIYLSARSSRYVQLQPWVSGTESSWTLHWGKNGESSVDAPTLAGPARVILTDPQQLSPGVRLKAFPEDLFPATVSATDGLDAVVLDHVPRWEPVRRAAFLDWIRRGGTLHLVCGPSGLLPVFTGDLAALNAPTASNGQSGPDGLSGQSGPEAPSPSGPQSPQSPQSPQAATHFGAGRVYHHAVSGKAVDEAFLTANGSPERKLEAGKTVSLYGFDSGILRNLASLTRPEIAWWLIYLLTISYLVVIGPVHFKLARKRDYRLMLGGYLGLVACYALAFAWVGKRGATETQRVHSLSVARSLGDGRYDVSQWTSPFIVKGGVYRLTHASPANLYSAGADQGVGGRIDNGRDGAFSIDLPVFSARPFIHQAVMTGPSMTLTASDWTVDADGKLTAVSLRPAAGWPANVQGVFLRDNSRFYSLKAADGSWTLADSNADAQFFTDVSADFNLNNNGYGYPTAPSAEWLKKTARLLMAWELGGAGFMQHYVPPPRLAAGQLQLFVFAPAPEAFRLQGGNFQSENGWVLYVANLSKNDR